MTLPGVSISVQSGGRPIVNSGLLRTHVVIGCAADGPLQEPRSVALDSLISTFKGGDAVKAAARAIDRVAASAVFVRVPSTPIPATKTTLFNVTGTAIPSITGTPTESFEIIFEVTTGGTIAAGNVAYSLTTDNGANSTVGLVPTSGLVPIPGTGIALSFDPPDNSLVALATDLRTKLLAHFGDAIAHNAADAAAIAAITLPAPTDNTTSIAVINQCLAALLLHLANSTVHDSVDSANVPSLGAAVTEQDSVQLEIEVKASYEAHRVATYPAATASLLALTASSVAIQSYTASTLLAAGVLQLDSYPSYITFTTDAAGTPSDAPPDATITGTNADTMLPDSEVVLVSQVAGTTTATKRFLATGITITYGAGDGPGALISIGTTDAAHNSADVTNTIVAANPDGGTLLLGDEVLVSTTDPSPALLSVAKSGGGTLTVTGTGTPIETVDSGRVEFLTAGTVGTIGISYRVSLDRGRTWQPAKGLLTATSIDVVDLRNDGTSIDLGVNIAFVAGQTVDVDTVITFRTTGPEPALADVLIAMDKVRESAFRQTGWRFYNVVRQSTGAEMAQIQTKVSGQQDQKLWSYAFAQFRDKRRYELEADWEQDIIDQRALLAADRVADWAGYAPFTCPITGRQNRRPAAWLDVVRRLCLSAQLESGQFDLGPLGSEINGRTQGLGAGGDVFLYENSIRIEHDAEIRPSLFEAGVSVLRTHTGEGFGVYVASSYLASNFQASKFRRTPHREVNDIISRAANSQGVKALLRALERNAGTYPTSGPVQPGDPGTITENSATTLESELRTAVLAAARGLVSSVTVAVSRIDDLTAIPVVINVQIVVEGMSYLEQLNVTQIFEG